MRLYLPQMFHVEHLRGPIVSAIVPEDFAKALRGSKPYIARADGVT